MKRKNLPPYHFFAKMKRMCHIRRWSLMRNTIPENLSEHSLEVAMIAHALAFISMRKYNKHVNPDHIAVIGMYHDCSEIITGDLPTPIKYRNQNIQNAYKDIESAAEETMINYLPEYMQKYYSNLIKHDNIQESDAKLIKAADKISALTKCIQERMSGNTEFLTAEKQLREAIRNLKCNEADTFMEEFIDSYSLTIDELENKG